MATITKGTTFASGDVVTPAKLNQLVDNATLSPIVTSDISDGAITTNKVADAQITKAKLAPTVLVPTGAVMPFAMNSAPTGWLAANGSAVNRVTYSDLFSVIGTTYGTGDGSTTFNLPDLRGYFVRGAGTNSDGKVAGTFGEKQNDAITAHTHTTNSQGAHSHFASLYIDSGSLTGTQPYYFTASPNGENSSGASAYSFSTTTSGSHNHTTSSQSPAGATETRPANIAMLYCIKF